MSAAQGKVFLGVNLSHDTACAAVIDGEVKVAIAEERLNRVKYCTGLTPFGKVIPYRSIRYCCDEVGIEPKEVDLFVVNSCRSNARDALREQLLGIDHDRIVDLGHPGHHLAHAYSAFYCSPFDEAAVLVLDTNGSFIEPPGGGNLLSKEHYGCFRGSPTDLEPVFSDLVRPGELSVGELYCVYSAALQLTPMYGGAYGDDCALSAGGKLMGLAAHHPGRSSAPELIEATPERLRIPIRRLLEHLRASGFVQQELPVDPDRIFGFQIRHSVQLKRRRHSLRRKEHLQLAGQAQLLLEEAVLELARRAYRETGCRQLCLAGGNFLNVVACTRILDETPFQSLFVQPAAGDAGNAIGAAIFGYREQGGTQMPYLNQPYSTYLGREYSKGELRSALNALGADRSLQITELPSESAGTEELCRLLADEHIVALFRGRSEFGPRALGHRSLLASPKQRRMLQRMNRLKGREWYRPVAPVVPEESFRSYFEAPYETSPFMTLAARVTPRAREEIPAVCHVDGTARPQTVSARQEPFLHRLLGEVGQAGRAPVLVNTSFNTGGEPIVETPEDALRTFQRHEEIRALLLGDVLLTRNRAP